MSIRVLDEMEAQMTGRRAYMPEPPRPLSGLVQVSDEFQKVSLAHEYRIGVRMGVARMVPPGLPVSLVVDEARMMMREYIFAEVLAGLREIQRALWNGDLKAATERTGELIAEVRG